MKENQKGFSAVEGLLVLIIVALIGFIGWYVWQANNSANESMTAADTASNTQVIPKNNITLKISDYSLELSVPSSLNDLTIGASREDTHESTAFSQAFLATDTYKICEGVMMSRLGSIFKIAGTYTKFPLGIIDPDNGVYIKQLDDFYLMYYGPQGYVCGEGTLDAEATYKEVKQAIIDNGWTHKTE